MVCVLEGTSVCLHNSTMRTIDFVGSITGSLQVSSPPKKISSQLCVASNISVTPEVIKCFGHQLRSCTCESYSAREPTFH